MWLAAGQSASGGLDPTQVIVTVGLVLAAAITAIGGVAVAIVNTKKKATAPEATSFDSDDWAFLRERVAKCEARIADLTDIAEISDRRHDQVERHLDLDNVSWRHNGGRFRP